MNRQLWEIKRRRNCSAIGSIIVVLMIFLSMEGCGQTALERHTTHSLDLPPTPTQEIFIKQAKVTIHGTVHLREGDLGKRLVIGAFASRDTQAGGALDLQAVVDQKIDTLDVPYLLSVLTDRSYFVGAYIDANASGGGPEVGDRLGGASSPVHVWSSDVTGADFSLDIEDAHSAGPHLIETPRTKSLLDVALEPLEAAVTPSERHHRELHQGIQYQEANFESHRHVLHTVYHAIFKFFGGKLDWDEAHIHFHEFLKNAHVDFLSSMIELHQKMHLYIALSASSIP